MLPNEVAAPKVPACLRSLRKARRCNAAAVNTKVGFTMLISVIVIQSVNAHCRCRV
ncbi:protein of unknown function [Candidatus Nitrotoga arctica]|uniref:Uncharacterized protein n=1 Tax=Candidatus Nitrotoga arctica TaxID=453162 RepID=A0ABN8AIM2_9PROT|nr:protein of unknown function [Candidatus Nitrotoga arctica]